jgi:hypothetical protein
VIFSNDYMQLITSKQLPVLGSGASLIDLFPLAAIDDVSASPEEHEFVVRYHTATDTKSIVLRSPSHKAIIHVSICNSFDGNTPRR